MTSSPRIILINHIRYSHTRYFVMIRLHRNLDDNQLIGTVPSSIGSLVKLYSLYATPTHDISTNHLDQSHSILTHSILDDDTIAQEPQQQSTERHHSIIDWLSHETYEIVRSIEQHPHCHSPAITTNRLDQSHSILTHSILDDDTIAQEPPQQSTEWHHSIIDWLSRESSLVVRQPDMQ